MSLKISRDGSVSDSAALPPIQAGDDGALEPQEHPGTGEEMHGTEHPADGTMSPAVEGAPLTPGEPAPEQVTELPPPPPVSAPKAEHVSYAAEVLEVPVDEAEAMRKAELVQLARDAAAEAAEPQAPDAAPGPAPAAPPRVPPRLPPGGADG